ncbi:hypothetical protein RQP46_002445 [Phenoliferia psychrophenolica]
MATQLATVKAFISAHESLDPPSPGKWSILRTALPDAFKKLLGSLNADVLLVGSLERTEVIRVLWDWLAVWDVYCWPADGAQSRSSYEKWRIPLNQLDIVRWELVQLMRYDVPSRIAETHQYGEKALEWLRIERDHNIASGKPQRPLIETEPVNFAYVGVALARTGVNNARAEKHLRDALKHLSQVGELNVVWSLDALERVLRAQGKDDEALVMHQKLVTFIRKRPEAFSPRALRELLLWPGEATTLTLADVDSLALSLQEAMRVNEAAFSALEATKGVDGSKAATHYVLINLEWIPRGVEPLDRFKVLWADAITNAEARRHFPERCEVLDEETRKFRKREATECIVSGTVFCRAILTGHATGINKDLVGTSSTMALPNAARITRERPHNADWVETLKSKMRSGGYKYM